MEHHDAITGTHKKLVGDDYEKIMDVAQSIALEKTYDSLPALSQKHLLMKQMGDGPVFNTV